VVAVATVDDEVFDFAELLVDRAESGAGFLTKVDELCFEARQLRRDLRDAGPDVRQTKRVLALICTRSS
jgi:hypothetical protein